jgi:hypothetical protein
MKETARRSEKLLTNTLTLKESFADQVESYALFNSFVGFVWLTALVCGDASVSSARTVRMKISRLSATGWSEVLSFRYLGDCNQVSNGFTKRAKDAPINFSPESELKANCQELKSCTWRGSRTPERNSRFTLALGPERRDQNEDISFAGIEQRVGLEAQIVVSA